MKDFKISTVFKYLFGLFTSIWKVRMMKAVALILFLVFSVSLSAQDNQNLQDQYRLNIRQTSEKITIDGNLSEPIWEDTEVATDFWMCYPVDDRKVDAQIQTEVRMAFDEQYIYLGVVCHGDDDYVIQTLKRDTDLDKGDGFGVVIDPVNEKTNGFAFGVMLHSHVSKSQRKTSDQHTF